MKKLMVIFSVVGLLVVGLFSTEAPAFELISVTETVVVNDVEVDIIRTADNFIILFDSSGSMDAPYKNTGKKKIEVEKEMLKSRNANFPDLTLNGGLYTFTPGTASLSLKTLKPYYEMKPYNKAEFAAAIDQLPDKASGPTLLQGGLAELGKILDGLSGRTVVFVYTDGKFTLTRGVNKPVESARKLAQKHDVCFYVVSNAPSQMEAQLLEDVASINACSRVIQFEDLVEKPGYLSGALFVLEERIVPRRIEIEKIIGADLGNIQFDFNQSGIGSEYSQGLTALGNFLKDTPQAYLVLSGFTDSIGDQEYNLDLSRRRAESVGMFMNERFGIAAERIVLQWYGEAAPVASNDTESGQRQNRRVEVIVAEMP